MENRGEVLYHQALKATDRRIFVMSLSQADKILYNRYKNKINQKKYLENPENRKKTNQIRKEHISTLRQIEPDKMKKQNLKDVKAFREREKQKLELIQNKAKSVLTNAIKNKKARQELDKLKALKKIEASKTAKSMIDDIMGKEIKKHANLTNQKKYQKKDKDIPAKLYNLRSRNK